jgi:hypothetical protein
MARKPTRRKSIIQRLKEYQAVDERNAARVVAFLESQRKEKTK